jgi:hypothetical protein
MEHQQQQQDDELHRSSGPRMSQNAPRCPAPENSLNDRQLAAIEMLAMGKSYTAAAEAMAIDRKTLYRWRQSEPFTRRLEERRRELWEAAGNRLMALIHPSLDVLETQLQDPFDRARFAAAVALLRLANLKNALNNG